MVFFVGLFECFYDMVVRVFKFSDLRESKTEDLVFFMIYFKSYMLSFLRIIGFFYLTWEEIT